MIIVPSKVCSQMPFTRSGRPRKCDPSRISLFRQPIRFCRAILPSKRLGCFVALTRIRRFTSASSRFRFLLLSSHHNVLRVEQEWFTHSRLTPFTPIRPSLKAAFVVRFLPTEDLSGAKQIAIGCTETMCDHGYETTPYCLEDNMGIVSRTDVKVGVRCTGSWDDRCQ